MQQESRKHGDFLQLDITACFFPPISHDSCLPLHAQSPGRNQSHAFQGAQLKFKFKLHRKHISTWRRRRWRSSAR